MRRLIYTAAALALLSSCSLYKSFKAPAAPTAEVVGAEVATHDTTALLPAWQEVFEDPALQALISKGITSNADLQIARLHIEQAEALLLSSKLAYLPSLALTPDGSISKTKDAKAISSYNLPLTMQWELDLFGRLRNSKEQARASLMQSAEYARMVQTQLVASIANIYYTLLMLDEQLAITQEFIQNQQENLEAITAMKEAGIQNESAVNQATASLYSMQSSAQDLKTQIRKTENSMALLLNQPPHRIERGTLAGSKAIGIDYEAPIPLVALSHRPDVKEAEYALRRSFYGVNTAHSAFYPSITLTGSAGWTNNVGVIVNPGQMLLSAIGSLTQPLFSRGANIANLKVAKAQYEQAMIGFEKALLAAGSEANDALLLCQNSAAKQEMRRKQVEASEQAWINSQALMEHSSMTYLEVLIAQSSFLQAQLLQAADWMEGMQGHINLYKALGGGVSPTRCDQTECPAA